MHSRMLLIIFGISFLVIISSCDRLDVGSSGKVSKEITESGWAGFKAIFIDASGKVNRIKDGDVVSEGQAYAMLRAAWMDDKACFDKCYSWTEDNLSRVKTKGDNLLAWRWKDGEVNDWMSASDADVDYALSLIFADCRWSGGNLAGVEDYGGKAKAVLSDILNKETFRTSSGRLYLGPWVTDDKNSNSYALNPSYYSPAHFRIFYEYTKDKRWLELVDTSYYMLNKVTKKLGEVKGVGLVPDWCSVDNFDNFDKLEGRNSGFGYEALRLPFRVALDYYWFDSDEAKRFLVSFSRFLNNQMELSGAIYCEYDYSGKAVKVYEGPAFYGCYYFPMKADSSKYAQFAIEATRKYIKRSDDGLYYQSKDEYYSNCLSWLADGYESGYIKNIADKDK